MKKLILLIAFIIASMTIAMGQNIEDPQNNPNKLSFLLVSNDNNEISTLKTDLLPSAESLEILNSITFGVIVGVFTYSVPIQSEFCKPIRDDLIITQTNDGYVYSVGAFKNYAEADQLLENLKKIGYANAAIFSFYKNMPILKPLTDITTSLKNQ